MIPIDGLSAGLCVLVASLLLVIAWREDRRTIGWDEHEATALELVRYPDHDQRRWVKGL